MTEHRISTQEEWQAERDELLKEEKDLTRWGDELAIGRSSHPRRYAGPPAYRGGGVCGKFAEESGKKIGVQHPEGFRVLRLG